MAIGTTFSFIRKNSKKNCHFSRTIFLFPLPRSHACFVRAVLHVGAGPPIARGVQKLSMLSQKWSYTNRCHTFSRCMTKLFLSFSYLHDFRPCRNLFFEGLAGGSSGTSRPFNSGARTSGRTSNRRHPRYGAPPCI